MKTLKEIFSFLQSRKKAPEIQAQDLEVDSRAVKSGDVFVAVKGTKVNGLDYALKAQEQGAVLIVYENDNELSDELLEKLAIPALKIPAKKTLADFASWFYDEPSKRLGLIGVTGTNGKSTITQLIAQWFAAIDVKCAVLGTLGFGFLPKLEKSANTTLDCVRLQRSLSSMAEAGARYAALEVSSIGVCEGRIDGCTFAAGGFTNLTRDHLDYHGTMENYAKAKGQFLQMLPQARAVINVDNEQGVKYAEDMSNCVVYSVSKNFTYSSASSIYPHYLWVKSITYRPSSIAMEIESSYGQGRCEIGLLGHFNVENFACAFALMLALGIPFDKLISSACALKPICGRMECFKAPGKPNIVVDYAHTPDGVEQVLRGVREHHENGRIFCVLGCGGDRDKGKRPIMAIKASVYADVAVFTSDNPRTEDPAAILADMAAGVNEANNVVLIEDRLKAIEYAFTHASENDCVVIAGKGHEDYQIFKDRTIHFSDRETACGLLGVKCD